MRTYADDERDLLEARAEVRRTGSDRSIARHDAILERIRARELAEVDRAIAEDRASATWAACARRSSAGAAYLRGRGVDPAPLVDRDLVRFGQRAGDPCVALHALDEGRIVNVVRRRIAADGGPKVLGMRGCGTRGSLVGRIGDITTDRRDVVLAEGVVDSLVAALAWPDAVVVGAHGAGAMPAIAAAAVPRVRELGGRMLVVPHADAREGVPGAGERAALEACRLAVDAGLDLGRDLELVDLGGAKDLADAWRDGWRPT